MKKNSSAAFFLVLTVLAFLGGSGFVLYQWSQLGSAIKDHAEALSEYKDEDEVAALVKQSEEDLAQATTELEHLERSVPQAAYVPTMLRELEALGKANGIYVTGVRPRQDPPAPVNHGKDKDKKEEKKPYDEIVVEVKGQGDYAAAQAFVDAIQSFPKIVSVETATLTPIKRTRESMRDDLLEVKLDIRCYVFAPEGEEVESLLDRGPEAPAKADRREVANPEQLEKVQSRLGNRPAHLKETRDEVA